MSDTICRVSFFDPHEHRIFITLARAHSTVYISKNKAPCDYVLLHRAMRPCATLPERSRGWTRSLRISSRPRDPQSSRNSAVTSRVSSYPIGNACVGSNPAGRDISNTILLPWRANFLCSEAFYSSSGFWKKKYPTSKWPKNDLNKIMPPARRDESESARARPPLFF